MPYAVGLAALIALIAVVVVYRQRTSARPARHRADVQVPNLWKAWRQRAEPRTASMVEAPSIWGPGGLTD
jgi:hypothetical protein